MTTSAVSSGFPLLDSRIQRFIWAKGWTELREAQEAAIRPILLGEQDIIIAAATAAGKTEAAMFPALTHLLAAEEQGLIVYVSPLKALINDQHGRLRELCEGLDVPVWPWHGDIAASSKTKFFGKPTGILLITPESLEAMLCNKGTAVATIFKQTEFFVVDELHAFIGSERGKQLQSLMHRIERVRGARVPRIGLSATLGDMQLAADFLRPGFGSTVHMVETSSTGLNLKLLVKGFEEPGVIKGQGQSDSAEAEPVTPGYIGAHLFKTMRGSNNLVFPNSRREVERYTHLLTKLCEEFGLPNEFWPHHGSLSKEVRSDTEAALKQKNHPATAIATSTLELGMDIGEVRSVAQIGPPPSVMSLRQRLGRSGRRSEPGILWGYCIEDAIHASAPLETALRLNTVQTIAMVTLLLENWFEPPRAHQAHLSTLVQQLLAAIAQLGGASPGALYRLLCAPNTPFSQVSQSEFMLLLKQLGVKDLIVQDSGGSLLHGKIGEKFVNHYTFYAAFATEEEFRIVTGGKPLGTLPVTQALTLGQRILFAGKAWRVDEVDDVQKTIYVTRKPGGAPPMFASMGGRVHTRVRQKMRELLEGTEMPSFLDVTAKRFLAEARQHYAYDQLDKQVLIDQGRDVLVLTWLGDEVNEALAFLLQAKGFTAVAAGPGVEVLKGELPVQAIVKAILEIAAEPAPSLDILLGDALNLQREKWDWALPVELLRIGYASHNLDVEKALEWAKAFDVRYSPKATV